MGQEFRLYLLLPHLLEGQLHHHIISHTQAPPPYIGGTSYPILSPDLILTMGVFITFSPHLLKGYKMTERTKKELEEEIENLKSILKSLSSSQIKLIDNTYDINKLAVRYQAKIQRIDRIFARQVQMA